MKNIQFSVFMSCNKLRMFEVCGTEKPTLLESPALPEGIIFGQNN